MNEAKRFTQTWKYEQLNFGNVYEILKEKYKITNEDSKFIEHEVVRQLKEAAEEFGGMDNLKGKRILVLGCGSRYSEGGFNRQFEPWFCRGLRELGADPVGIDYDELEPEKREEFEYHAVNLSKNGDLDFLLSHSFDGVQMMYVLNSPEMVESILGYGAYQRIMSLTSEERQKLSTGSEKITQELKTQIKRLLKTDGIEIRMDWNHK